MIIILGGQSQLANYLKLKIKRSKAISRKHCDVTKFNDLKKMISKYRPKYVFNCSAYHNTILCEKNYKKCFNINSFSLRSLAYLSNVYKFKIIHFSTDYVFDGEKKRPYLETDLTNPLNIYGQSKLLGEYFIKSYSHNYLIIRLSSIFSHFPCRDKKGLNFIDKMIELSSKNKELFVNNLEISPTYVGDIANQVNLIYKIVNNETIHCTSLGSTTWFDFAKEIFKRNNIKIKLNKVSNFDGDSIIRPKYTVLKNNYLIKKKLNVMPDWKTSYDNYVKDQYLKKTNYQQT